MDRSQRHDHLDDSETPAAAAPRSRAFVWPPKHEHDVSMAPHGASENQTTPLAHIPAQILPGPDHHSAATTWLGQVREPLRVRLARSGIDLSHPIPYCPRCGVSVALGEISEDDPASGCHACHRVNLPWDRFVRLGEYEDEVRRVVLDIKFGRWRELGEEMGVMAGEHLMQRLQRAGLAHLPIILVPIPMHVVRRMMRGIDHTASICRGMARATGGQVVTALRSRSWRHTQLDVVASQREAHARASLASARWPGPSRLARAVTGGGVVVIVDDVKTTGSTMAAACRRVRELLKSGTGTGYKTLPLWGLTLAVTQPGREG